MEVEEVGFCSMKNNWVKSVADNHAQAKTWKAGGHRIQCVSPFAAGRCPWNKNPRAVKTWEETCLEFGRPGI